MRFVDQNALPEAVKGRYPEPPGDFPIYQPGHPLAHFASSLVSEGDCANMLRSVTLLDQPRYLARDNAGFSTAGAGQYQAGPVDTFNRLSLRLIEILQVQGC
jgi:hypothetical protein